MNKFYNVVNTNARFALLKIGFCQWMSRFGSSESMASQPGLRETDLVAASRQAYYWGKSLSQNKNKNNNNNKNNKMPIPIPISNEAGRLKTKAIKCS